ncbi:MAG: UbiA-like polyprenyltransferase [Saprospiraceae bacterium]
MKSYLSLIKFSHSIFALPFAIIGALLGHRDGYDLSLILFIKIILCMVLARGAAMAFNRLADERYDRLNPRTAGREIPSGVISKQNALWFVIFCCVAFVMTTFFINRICFYLSPVALITILGYSFTKRWTALCHLILGSGLALAPIGSYLAVTGKFSLIPVLFSGVVFYWVSGFDIIYALQDEDFDKSQRLHSIPAWLGKERALKVSRILHLICALILLFVSWQLYIKVDLRWSFMIWVAAAIFITMLVYQHTIVSAKDLSKVNLAFFTTNGLASVIYGALLGLALLI